MANEEFELPYTVALLQRRLVLGPARHIQVQLQLLLALLTVRLLLRHLLTSTLRLLLMQIKHALSQFVYKPVLIVLPGKRLTGML